MTERAGSATAIRAWHGVLAVVVAAALIAQIVLLFTGGQDANSGQTEDELGAGVRLARLFSYFTIQSNIVVLAAAIGLVLRPHRDGRVWRVLRVDSLLAIAITGLVFTFVLLPMVQLSGLALWVSFALHAFSPVWTIVGWFLFGPRPRIDLATIGWAFAWPVAWIVFTFVRGAATDWYPYPFLNAAELGLGVALRNTAGVLVLAAVLALVFRAADRLPVIRPRPRI
ncbi:conserved hypothetical protein [Beutenbergia cavernae DSM 12333]|uniref:Integral membrane protein n=1 Tax=Beutenbergia cavernae (strain ATCC BAA-8 / DSM 12333 / CCUG 43141 / JCM 11478 / NBRC 16432 / NCIMB 13614 / HKI 0122) TaxID=471853 RepID=C5C657_BEUC1|nr:conserved hypothetical protein [Beutenbergia cavernae DSM 12333]